MNQRLLALYGLKWNPFSPDVPTEALYVPPQVENFCWRIEQAQLREGGFALVHGDPGSGKSVVMRLLAERLARLTDLAVLSRLRDELAGSKALNGAMQDFLREWSAVSGRRNPATLLDQAGLEWFAELNRGLRDPLDDEAFKQRIRATTAQLRQLAREIVATACARHPHLPAEPVLALLDASPSAQASLLFDTAA